MKHSDLSVRRQCKLLNLTRSSLYYARQPENERNLELMRRIDEIYTETPFYGIRKITEELRNRGYSVNHKRVRRLMRRMGLEAIYPKPNLSRANKEHRVYPYLLKDLTIDRPKQVWATDITYIPMERGFLYLVAILDWYSRYVLSWRVSTMLDTGFCLEALREALEKHGCPDIFNTDQGSQFTSQEWTGTLQEAGIRISMDGKGRYLDNIFTERLWRTVKYEDIYIKRYETVRQVKEGLTAYFDFYNHRRLHQALDYKTPAILHIGQAEVLKGQNGNFSAVRIEKPFKTPQGFEQLSDTVLQYDDEVKINQDRLRA